jgi:hypothetical protein
MDTHAGMRDHRLARAPDAQQLGLFVGHLPHDGSGYPAAVIRKIPWA